MLLEDRLHRVSLKEASFDIERTAIAVDEVAAPPRRIGILIEAAFVAADIGDLSTLSMRRQPGSELRLGQKIPFSPI